MKELRYDGGRQVGAWCINLLFDQFSFHWRQLYNPLVSAWVSDLPLNCAARPNAQIKNHEQSINNIELDQP